MIPGSGDFTRQLRCKAESYFERFVHHPFQKALREGTLSPGSFGRYLTQDALYLLEDARAFTRVAERCEEESLDANPGLSTEWLAFHSDAALFFRAMASDSYALEQAMQNHFFRLYQLSPASEPSEVCGAYSRFLLQHAENAPIPVALAALLPCFWLFQEASLEPWVKPNPYQPWLTTYGGELYLAFTEKCIGLLEESINLYSHRKITECAIEAFLAAALWECQFLDEASQSSPDRFKKGSIEGS